MPASIPPRESLPPRLGRYEVRAKIGDGGMATVYLGRLVGPPGLESSFERVVALKVIKEAFSTSPEFVTMFLDEAKIISRLSHPNVVHVIELGTEGDRLFIAMELLFGQSLWRVWDACRQRDVRLRYDMAAWIGARVADGLHHAHELKDPSGTPLDLVHRDVNASNIFVTYDGHVKVIDFGLAKAGNRAYKTAAGVVKGKLAYLAPEQVAGQPVDCRADVFALGTTLWELTVDQRLFRVKDDSETLKRVYAANVPDPTALVEGYPQALWQIIKRALSRDANARYATAAEFARALDEYTRMEGRMVNPTAAGEMMRELFEKEQREEKAWIEDASAPDRPAPQATMHPPPGLTHPPPVNGVPQEMQPPTMSAPAVPREAATWRQGAPPDGMFSPAPSRPPFQMPMTHDPPPQQRASTPAPAPAPAPPPPASPRSPVVEVVKAPAASSSAKGGTIAVLILAVLAAVALAVIVGRH